MTIENHLNLAIKMVIKMQRVTIVKKNIFFFKNNMACQIPADCLNEIFGYLNVLREILHSCLLVNRFWCEVVVRILWKDIWSFTNSSLKLISILIACLPNESKDLLCTNEIFI